MTRGPTKPDWQRALIALSAAVITTLIVMTLYHARVIFIPLALAIFLTFVLAPLVRMLQRRGVPRLPAMISVVLVAVLSAGCVAYVIGVQVAGLTRTLPDYAENIKEKIGVVKEWAGASSDPRMTRLIEDLQEAISPSATPAPAGEPTTPQTVVVAPRGGSWMTQIEGFVSPAVEVLGQLAFAFILVVFLLLKKEDMRNRVLRLVAGGRVTTATKAVDDASRRVSRYLLVQLLLNSAFGVTASLGLYLLGVQYALLWGFIGFLMRYVPYVGTLIGLVPPAVFAMATADEIWRPIVVVVMFLGLETICNNVFEPWLYGRSLGMSEVAQLVAAAFWAFLWGPIGLILSGPLTTCLLVLGKYVPSLKFLDVLLGHEPPLSPGVMFFQRLAARDQDEASRIIREHAADRDLAEVFDGVVVESLKLTLTAAEEGELDEADEKYVLGTVSEIVEDIGDEAHRQASEDSPEVAPAEPIRLLACPARDEGDRTGLAMLGILLGPDRWEVDVASSATLTSELITRVEDFKPAVVCIGSLPPGGLAHTRYLCKRLKRKFPDLKLVVGRWGQDSGVEEAKRELTEAGADEVYVSLAEARQQFSAWLPVMQSRKPDNGNESLPAGKTSQAQALVGTGRA